MKQDEKMNTEAQQPARACVLKLEGRCTIERVHELKGMLLEALGVHDHIILDLRDVVEVDVACLQLLCSAHRASLKSNKHLALDDNKPDVFKRVVRNAGYARTLGCHNDPMKSCMWKGAFEQ
jgi:anti-anti-sigma factor